MNYKEKLREMIAERNQLILQKDKSPKYLRDQLIITIKNKEEEIRQFQKEGGFMKSWIIEGLKSGFEALAFFSLVMILWAAILKLSQNLGISPGWSILAFFVIALFSISLATAKAKYDLETKFGGKE